MLGLTRVFFTTDVHGSNICFRKFLNAAKYYQADVLILGGDITGKAIVPIVNGSRNTYHAHFEGEDIELENESAVLSFEKRIGDFGFYSFRCDANLLKTISEDATAQKELFIQSIRNRLAEWVELCDSRMAAYKNRIFVNAGNDDFDFVDSILDQSKTVRRPEGKVEHVDEYLTMISTGYANETPFHCPRDASENELRMRIDAMAAHVKDYRKCIFNFHCPPYGTVLDQGPDLDTTLRPKMSGVVLGGKPIGSTAVRDAIREYQPCVGLHGHVHESRGICHIGGTICINPGSMFQHGQLRGAILEFQKGELRKDPILVEG